jgi:hypothetical protein
MKETLSAIAVALTFLAYIPYYRDIIKGKTHPHLYSWALWGLLTIMIVALQIKGGAGPSTYVTASSGLLCIGVIFLCLKNVKKDITMSDTFVAALSLIAMGFWLIADKPIVSIVLVVMADLLAFVPTVRKSWNKPHTETLSLYVTNTVRFTIAVMAIQNYTLLAVLWPVSWAIANGLFSVLLVIRRRQITS